MRKILSKHKAFFAFGIPALSAALLAGCNLYSFIDKPKGDEQILSAARACFDRADYACAREYYAQLSASYADIKASEEAFMILAENGAGMAAFMETFGSGGGASGLNDLAERLAPGSVAKRQKMQEAFAKYLSITGDPNLRALVRFVSAVALSAEMLAEEIPAGQQLTKARIADNSSTCACGGAPECTKPGGAVIQNGNTDPVPEALPAEDAFLATADLSGNIDTGHVRSAINEIYLALSQIGASGGFSSGAGAFADAAKSQPLSTSTEQNCFRWFLLDQGIGR